MSGEATDFLKGSGKLADLSRLIGAAVTELADVHDSKSCGRKLMGVRLSPAAPIVRDTHDSN